MNIYTACIVHQQQQQQPASQQASISAKTMKIKHKSECK
jgi:hypothetical protein